MKDETPKVGYVGYKPEPPFQLTCNRMRLGERNSSRAVPAALFNVLATDKSRFTADPIVW